MAEQKITTNVLATMIEALEKATHIRDKNHEAVLVEIKESQKESAVHLKETKEQVYDVKGKVMRLSDKIVELEKQVAKNTEDIGALKNWKWYLAGIFATVFFIITTPLIYERFLKEDQTEQQLKEMVQDTFSEFLSSYTDTSGNPIVID